jgi:alpha-tubulin suppressor-like RCC1 family protein
MGLMTSGAQVWRDFNTDGLPSSGPHSPDLGEIRAYQLAVERELRSGERRVLALATTAPTSPTELDRYIVATAATGDFAAHINNVAEFYNSEWHYEVPYVGYCVYVVADSTYKYWDGTVWRSLLGAATDAAAASLAAAVRAETAASTAVAAVASIGTGGGGGGTSGALASYAAINATPAGIAKVNGHGGGRFRVHWTVDGRIVSVGDNSAFGYDVNGDNWSHYVIPTNHLNWASTVQIEAIYVGQNYILVQTNELAAAGNLYHCGASDYNQNGSNTTTNNVLTKVSINDKFVDIKTESSVGNTEKFWFGLTASGNVVGCGSNVNGTQGVGTTTGTNGVHYMYQSDGTTLLSGIAEVTCCSTYTPVWARTTDGKAYRWGAATSGAHASGETTPTIITRPALLGGVSTPTTGIAKIVVTGASGTAARAVSLMLTTAGKLKVAGDRAYGAGDGDALGAAAQASFDDATGAIAAQTITQIIIGGGEYYHLAAIDSAGQYWMCGYVASYGQAGDGSLTNRNVFFKPTLPTGFQGAVQKVIIGGGSSYTAVYVLAIVSGIYKIASVGYDVHYQTGKKLSGTGGAAQIYSVMYNTRGNITLMQSIGENQGYGFETLNTDSELMFCGFNDQGQAGSQSGNLHNVDCLQPCRLVGPRLIKPPTPHPTDYTYNAAITYTKNDLVRDSGSTWLLTANSSVGIAPPALPTTSNASWALFAQKGDVGSGGGGAQADWNATSGLAQVLNKPTTLAGYGIADAYTQTQTNTQISAAVAALVNSAPGTLDTLGELATQLAADESASAALVTTVGGKLAKSANLSDLVSIPTALTNLGLAIKTVAAVTMLGVSVGGAITTGDENTFVGINSAYTMTTGSRNTTLGKNNLINATNVYGNLAIGLDALKSLTTGTPQAGTVSTHSYNIAIGDQCLKLLGIASGTGTGAFENICIGNNVGIVATTAYYATGMGSEALRFLTTGNSNAAYGVVALHGVTTGNCNTGMGNGTGMDANGLASDAVGSLAVTSGSYNSFLGHSANCAAVNQPNYMTVIGAQARGNKDNTIFLGRNQDFVNIGYSPNTARLSISGQSSTSWPLINLDMTGNMAATPLANANAGDIWYTNGGTDNSRNIWMQLKSSVVYGLTGGTNVPAVTTSNTIDFQAILTGVKTFIPALSNGNYSLFIGKNCGNTSMGSANIAGGSGGTNNFCIGIGVGTNLSTGANNFFLGAGNGTTCSQNIIIGVTGTATGLTSNSNLVIGSTCGVNMTAATQNVVLAGFNSFSAATTAYNNVVIGNVCANALVGGGQNVFIGYGTASGCTSAANNTFVGYSTGLGVTTGGNNTVIGGSISGLTTTLASTIIISHGAGSTLANALLVANATAGRYSGLWFDVGAPSAITTAANVTLTAAQVISGTILRSGNSAAITDTTPTAALIVAAVQSTVANQRFKLIIQNNNTGTGVITLAAGTGVTLSGVTTVAVGFTREYLVLVTNATSGSEAVTIYGIQTATS